MLGRQQPLVGDLALVDDEERGVLEPARGEHPGQVAGDGLDGIGRGAVEHHGHCGGAVGRELQELPGHLVGVARGRGDEDPQVGRGEQLGREDPVGLLDGVDVGSVQDCQAGVEPVAGDQLQRTRVVGRMIDALQLGEQAVLAEPVAVLGVVHQHRRAGRRAEQARRGHLGADERVDQRRLAGTGGAAHDREHGRVDGHHPRDDVVLELLDHGLPRRPLLVGAGQVQRQGDLGQRLMELDERGHHPVALAAGREDLGLGGLELGRRLLGEHPRRECLVGLRLLARSRGPGSVHGLAHPVITCPLGNAMCGRTSLMRST